MKTGENSRNIGKVTFIHLGTFIAERFTIYLSVPFIFHTFQKSEE